jgi:hypothetical protein
MFSLAALSNVAAKFRRCSFQLTSRRIDAVDYDGEYRTLTN